VTIPNIITDTHPALFADFSEQSKNELMKFSLVVQRPINFGSHLLMDYVGGEALSTDEGLACLMFRGCLVRADGVARTIAAGGSEQAVVLARSLLEAMLQLAYLVDSPADRLKRARSFLYWELKDQEYWANQATTKNPVSDRISVTDKARKSAAQVLEEVSRRDQDPNYSEIVAEYKTVNRRRKCPWYSAFGGKSNLRDLAESLGMHLEYSLYKSFSKFTHAGDVSKHMITDDSLDAQFKPINNAEGCSSAASCAATFMVQSIRVFIDKLAPEHREQFRKWYVLQMKKEFMRVTNTMLAVSYIDDKGTTTTP
jgi:hypothetical protein